MRAADPSSSTRPHQPVPSDRQWFPTAGSKLAGNLGRPIFTLRFAPARSGTLMKDRISPSGQSGLTHTPDPFH